MTSRRKIDLSGIAIDSSGQAGGGPRCQRFRPGGGVQLKSQATGLRLHQRTGLRSGYSDEGQAASSGVVV
jgi:hypothetical protein